MLIDLQLHSTYSDGYLTPTQIVKFIAKHGIKVAAITDHNTVSGLYEFRNSCKKYKIKPITGI
jgi:predicted metal-dependent phosphoesterase TrpH